MQRIVLHHVEGPRQGQADTFQQPAINVGRAAECHLAFPTERGVSTHHARIEQRDGAFEVVDNHSTNGSFINDERIERQILKAGDLVRFGAFGPVVKIELPDAVVAQPAPVAMREPPAFAATMALSAADLANAKTQMGIETLPPQPKAPEAPRAPSPRVAIATVETPAVEQLDADLFEDNAAPPPPRPSAPPMAAPAPPMAAAPPMPAAPPQAGGRPGAPPPPRPAAPAAPGVANAPPPGMGVPMQPAPPRQVQPGSGSGAKVWIILGGALILGIAAAGLLFWLKFKH